MPWTRINQSARSLFYCLAVLCFTLTAIFYVAGLGTAEVKAAKSERMGKRNVSAESPAAVFTNPAPITIPLSGNASPYPSAIAVAGLTGNIAATPGSVKVTLNGFSHTFPGDVGIVLVGPTGAAFLLQDGCGDDAGAAMTNVTYTLSDTGATQLPNLTAWTAGTFRPAAYFTGDSFPAPGPGTTYGNPGPAGGGTATFASVFAGTAPNGTWNLFVRDFAGGDSGGIAGGWTLEIIPEAVGPVNDALADFNEDGATDYAVVRNAGGINGQISWFIKHNAGGQEIERQWGLGGDTFIPGDFDGDGKDDIAVWRPGVQSTFFIIESETSTIRKEPFGISGDLASVVGDYNDDGTDDLAVYREGVNPGDQSVWYFNTTPNGFPIAMPWGLSGDAPVPGDYDGDGRMDFAVQRPTGPDSVFYIKYADDGAEETVTLGLADDITVPGDYNDDGATDLCVISPAGAVWQWTFRPSGGGANVIDLWGIVATDLPAPGDYNGDGGADYAVWRFGAQSTFYVMTPVTRNITTTDWGLFDDAPVTQTYTH